MNYLIEGLQGSGKSTLAKRLSVLHPDYNAIVEGEYSPIELAWCAYVGKEEYEKILSKYAQIRSLIEEKTVSEGDRRIICYTKIKTDIPGFYPDLEQYEIYNSRMPFSLFRETILTRYRRWRQDRQIFECSIFQNIVEDMMLFLCAVDAQILDFYRDVKSALEGKDYRIIYLHTEDIEANFETIKKERQNAALGQSWISLMTRFFDGSPYAVKTGVHGEKALLDHLRHRQALEERICREIFSDNSVFLPSKQYTDEDLLKI